MITPKSYTRQELVMVWNKGTIVPGINPAIRRKDICGAWIDWLAYGDRESNVGWEVDHAFPLSKGGVHHINNVRPLHWQNNARKSDGALICAVYARG
ncbi:MAG: HNH endonuclease [Candidatus Nomurabacteria bacterium]|nr:HNH endonuclease [Candidatus Nomurabacteria bacterium]